VHSTVAAIIERYRLEPLPVEGTLFASTYRSQAETPDGGPVGTAMIGLCAHEPLSRSLFHRLPTDEVWQAGELHPDGMYALFGCTMAPGFTGAGFEGGRRSTLAAEYPSRLHDIVRLAVPDDDTVEMPEGFAT
jgi:predicted cupin superfamily sugar epimerase